MTKDTISHPATPAMSAGTSKASPNGAKAGSPEQASKSARRAYELYEQRGRQDGRALEDWLKAERQLVGAASRS